MRYTPYLLIMLAFLTFSNYAHAQIIKSIEIEPAFGVSRVDLQIIKSENPDFINYLSQENIVIDAAHAGVNFRFNLINNWVLSLLTEKHVEFAPFLVNMHVTKKITDNWGINAGIGTESFIIGSIEKEYEHLKDRFLFETDYYYQNNPGNILSTLTCPFIGLKYYHETGKFSLRYTLNTGVAINRKLNRYLYFKEIGSNYVFSKNYDIPSKASIMVKPEVYACYKFIDNDTKSVGLRFKISNFLTYKDLDYTNTNYEWTYDNKNINNVDMPKHWLNCLCLDIGLLFELK